LALDQTRPKGGDRKSEAAKSIASSDVIDRDSARSSEATAKLVGTNSAKVERTRRLKRDAPDLLQDVLDGKKMVNGAGHSHARVIEAGRIA
jgi:hypothetical protein